MKSSLRLAAGVASVLLGAMALLVFIATEAGAGHNSDHGAQCIDCHFQHDTSTVPYVARWTEQATRCEGCHNPTGAASNMNDIIIHNIGTNLVMGTNIIDCGTCHEVHNGGSDQAELVTYDAHAPAQTRTNLDWVRVASIYIPQATNPVIFHVRTNHYAFETNNPPWNGICQGCHTKTDYHRYDNTSDNSHEFGSDCMECHLHSSGFAGSGSCLTCHNKVADAGDGGPVRSNVVAKFGMASHHVSGTNVVEEDCAVCHYEAWDATYHKNNMIDLRNPDNTNESALISFTNLVRDVTNNVLEAIVTNVQFSFCLKCHDDDGATQSFATNSDAMNPFWSSTNRPANIYDAFNPTNSFHHAVRGPGSNDYCISSAANGDVITMNAPWNQTTTGGPNNDGHEVISCFDCHGVNGHGSDTNFNLRVQIATPTNSTAIETFCLLCHKSSAVKSGTGSYMADHSKVQHQATVNVYSCRGCHAGQVNDSGVGNNGAASPQILIHGGNFIWPSGTKTVNTNALHFMFGGWLDGWQPGTCYDGNCNHHSVTKGQGY